MPEVSPGSFLQVVGMCWWTSAEGDKDHLSTCSYCGCYLCHSIEALSVDLCADGKTRVLMARS